MKKTAMQLLAEYKGSMLDAVQWKELHDANVEDVWKEVVKEKEKEAERNKNPDPRWTTNQLERK